MVDVYKELQTNRHVQTVEAAGYSGSNQDSGTLRAQTSEGRRAFELLVESSVDVSPGEDTPTGRLLGLLFNFAAETAREEARGFTSEDDFFPFDAA